LLDQALNFSQVFYQRAHELNPTPELEAGMKRVRAKQALANQRLNEGNNLFQSKDYQSAVAKYQEASRLYPELDTTYLRLGDTYEMLKQWTEAKNAYDKAVALSPSLMDSKGFSKNYQRIAKRANHK
jgi:tetratricopeptide (TPR) repeat protein